MSAGGSGTSSVPPQARRRVLDFSKNVKADGRPNIDLEMPFDGYVTDPFLAFPGNTRETFGVQIRDMARSQVMLPYNPDKDFMFLDGVQEFFPTSFPVREGEQVRVEFWNQHTSQDRFMPVYVPFVGDRFLPLKANEAIEARDQEEVDR
jgi:hypothetical protein